MKPVIHFILGAMFLVTASAYTPMRCEGGATAADGTQVRPGKTCAVSRDLRHLLGKHIHIEGVGRRLVNDLMAARWRKGIDVSVQSKKAAYEFGRKQLQIKVEGK